jgi:acyl carrier protein
MEDRMNGNSAPDAAVAAAHTETEGILLQIWSEVLNIEGVGIHDDFLGLGGDSLAAMRCINRINARFGVELPLDLFLLESAHIVQVASEIARMQFDTAQSVAPENR